MPSHARAVHEKKRRASRDPARPAESSREREDRTLAHVRLGTEDSQTRASTVAEIASDARLPRVQRRALLAEIGQVQGNCFLSRIVAAEAQGDRTDSSAAGRAGADAVQLRPARRRAARRPRKQAPDSAAELRETVYFAKALDQPVATDVEKLEDLALIMLDPKVEVYLRGYTSTEGSAKYNQDLSERRAMSIQSFLIIQGVDAKRIHWQAFGKRSPAVDEAGATPEEVERQRALNRRVEIDVVRSEPSPLKPHTRAWVFRTIRRLKEAEPGAVDALKKAQDRLERLKKLPKAKLPPILLIDAQAEVTYREQILKDDIQGTLKQFAEAAEDPALARRLLVRRGEGLSERRIRGMTERRTKVAGYLQDAQARLASAVVPADQAFWKEVALLCEEQIKEYNEELKWLQKEKEAEESERVRR